MGTSRRWSPAPDHPAVAQLGDGIGPVVSLIAGGESEAGARLFVEQVIGPGAWEDMPPEERAAMIRNAGTFVDEQRDPDWAGIDLEALAAFPSPVLLTQGDQSPPFFSTIIARLAEAMDRASVKTLPGAGHVPHATHPAEWVAVVREFANGVS